ncbi:conserved exported hypothetical protein [Verrucomicrobia bacterium]|nr:conserved exported hypothetical protein [Verrucomicrobiota bacterium]
MNERTNIKASKFPLVALATAWAAIATQAPAVNLLTNPSFEQNAGHAIPIGWARFAPPTAQTFGDYWIENNPPVAHTGNLYWKQWGASYGGSNNVAGIYQVLSSAPGSVYGGNGWFYVNPTDVMGQSSFTWVEVAFLGSSSNILAIYKSDNFTANVGTGAWFQYQITNACDVTQPVSLGDPYFTNSFAVTGAVTQLVAPAGTTAVRYQFCYLQGVTLGTSDGGSCYFDDADLEQLSGAVPPVISNLYPLNMIFVPPGDGLSFNVSSPSGFTINNSSIHVIVNGVDVSGSLAISGSSSNKNVAYHGLQSNLTYNASITVTDVFNLTANASTYFETTWVGTSPVVYLWEAEDWDFTNGMYLDNPDLCNADGDPNCYFGKVGTVSVDELNFGDSGNHLYRADDGICTAISGDYTRKNLAAAGRPDYKIDPFVGSPGTGEWVNYTRDWPSGTYWIMGRLASALSGSLDLSLVNPDQSTTDLGTFTITNGPGWTTYQDVLLRDTNGNIANITLSGKATLRVTSYGNLLPTFFALVVATADLPRLSGMYPTGTRPFEYTNTLSFTASTLGATFPANGIRVNLDGYDVSSNLVITGSSSNKSVVYPTLLPNAIHTAVISLSNSLGHSLVVTNQFDTFSEANYMVEAEDFDYDGGQYITPWTPDAYADYNGPYPAETNIDFHHTSLTDEVFHYRAIGIPQDGLNGDDYLRQVFVNAGGVDYVLVFFAGADWANYTRDYPAGSYYVYIRTSGNLGTTNTQYLDHVISGLGTSNQVTKRLGTWGAVGSGYTTFAWVPLTDEGLAAPAIVNLNGVTTLRITTAGNCNPNYFMLVPTSGISLTAARVGANVSLAFPTQAGVNYRVFYRTDLLSGNWALLTTVLGNGAVQHVSDPAAGAARFYKVVAP